MGARLFRRPPSGPRAPTKPAGGIEQIRAKLRARYSAAFGCEWDATPWGERWPELLEAANVADKEHDAAVTALQNLQVALKRVRAVAEASTVPHQASGADMMVGRTLGNALATAIIADHGAAWHAIESSVDEAVRSLAFPDPVAETSEAFGGALRDALTPIYDAPDQPEYWEHQRSLFAGMNRRIRRFTARFPSTEKTLSVVAPGLVGKAPRVTEGMEWRRGFIVELLDAFPVRRVPSGGWVVPSDTDIAVVSLLAGALDEMPENVLEGGFVVVLGNERKAVAQNRRRRAPTSRLTRRLTGESIRDVAPWKERPSRPKSTAKRKAT